MPKSVPGTRQSRTVTRRVAMRTPDVSRAEVAACCPSMSNPSIARRADPNDAAVTRTDEARTAFDQRDGAIDREIAERFRRNPTRAAAAPSISACSGEVPAADGLPSMAPEAGRVLALCRRLHGAERQQGEHEQHAADRPHGG